jgi:hypothetical protein
MMNLVEGRHIHIGRKLVNNRNGSLSRYYKVKYILQFVLISNSLLPNMLILSNLEVIALLTYHKHSPTNFISLSLILSIYGIINQLPVINDNLK